MENKVEKEPWTTIQNWYKVGWLIILWEAIEKSWILPLQGGEKSHFDSET